jgi:hypothetical protein
MFDERYIRGTSYPRTGHQTQQAHTIRSIVTRYKPQHQHKPPSSNHLKTIKMRFTSTFATGLVTTVFLLSSASARIAGFSAPSIVYAYNPFTVSLITEDYIQSVYDVAVAFGVAPGVGYPDSLGSIVASEYLGPAKSNILTPITFSVTLPPGTHNGQYTLSASVLSLYGAEYEPVLSPFNTTITVAGY